MVNAVVGARLLYGSDIGWLFYHADEPLIAGWVGAVATRVNISDVVAHGTEMKFFFKVSNG
jgi:hypothetical protein